MKGRWRKDKKASGEGNNVCSANSFTAVCSSSWTCAATKKNDTTFWGSHVMEPFASDSPANGTSSMQTNRNGISSSSTNSSGNINSVSNSSSSVSSNSTEKHTIHHYCSGDHDTSNTRGRSRQYNIDTRGKDVRELSNSNSNSSNIITNTSKKKLSALKNNTCATEATGGRSTRQSRGSQAVSTTSSSSSSSGNSNGSSSNSSGNRNSSVSSSSSDTRSGTGASTGSSSGNSSSSSGNSSSSSGTSSSNSGTTSSSSRSKSRYNIISLETPPLEEDLSYFSRRRMHAALAASEFSGTAAATGQFPTHLKNAAYAAAQSLRQSEQLLCDGGARAALKQALEGGSIYLPALCCRHEDYSIFEALMKDLLLYALRQQQEQQQEEQQKKEELQELQHIRPEQMSQGRRNICRQHSSPSGKEVDLNTQETSATCLSSLEKRDDEENDCRVSSFAADAACAITSPAGCATNSGAGPACGDTACYESTAEKYICSSNRGREGTSTLEKLSWRDLLRPTVSVKVEGSLLSSSTTGNVSLAKNVDQSYSNSEVTVAHEATNKTADSTEAAAAASEKETNNKAAQVSSSDVSEAALGTNGGGVVNWSCHLKHENPSFSKTFQKVVKQLSDYFCVEVYASRLNMYMDGSQWKPLHHDSHAYSSQQQQREDFTVGASFGAVRALEFVHVRSTTPYNNSSRINHCGDHQPTAEVRFLFPQRNGDVFAFNADVNRRFKHGVPPASTACRFSHTASKTDAPATTVSKVVATRQDSSDYLKVGKASARPPVTAPPATVVVAAKAPALKQVESGEQQRQERSQASTNVITTGDLNKGVCASVWDVGAPAKPAGANEIPQGIDVSTVAEARSNQQKNRHYNLEEIAAREAAAAVRAAAAATDGNGPRFSIIVWGRRKQLNDRNASLKELASQGHRK